MIRIASPIALLWLGVGAARLASAQPSAGAAAAANELQQLRTQVAEKDTELQKMRIELEQQRTDLKKEQEHTQLKEEQRKQAKERAFVDYQSAFEKQQEAQRRYDRAAPDAREAALQELKQAGDEFVKRALDAYARGAASERLGIRKQLFVTAALEADWGALVSVVAAYLRNGGEEAGTVTQLFDALSDQLRLARALCDPRNRAAVQQLLAELTRKYGYKGGDAPISNFGQAFEMLRNLNAQAFQDAASYAAEHMAVSDPETRLIRDRLKVVYVVDDDAARQHGAALDAFKQVFTDWMRETSPDRVADVFAFSGWGEQDVLRLMQDASRILSADDRAQAMPSCPQVANEPAQQRAKVLCGPSYAGVIAVELRLGQDGAIAPVASWRVNEQGTQLNQHDRFAVRGLQLLDAAAGEPVTEHVELRADEFAVKLLSEGTIYKRIRGMFDQLRRLDPQSLAGLSAAQLKPTDLPAGGGEPEPNARGFREPACRTCDPSAVSPALAAAWAGAPWRGDTSAKGDTFGDVIGVVDAVALLAGLVAGGVALAAHRAGSRDDDKWMAASVGSFGLVLGVRLVSGLGYWAFGPTAAPAGSNGRQP